MIAAFRIGVHTARKVYSIDPHPDADIVIADMYPFDADLQFAYDRGLWPLDFAGESTSKVVLAACPKGIGSHELFPLQNSLSARLIRRLKYFRLRDLRTFAYRLTAARRLVARKSLEVLVVSPGLTEAELQTVFPSGALVPDWSSARQILEAAHPAQKVKAAVYRTAPLMIPAQVTGSQASSSV